MTPTELAEQYFTVMRRRDLDGVIALFADDSVMILPDGKEVEGRAALRELYARIFWDNAPTPAPVATIAGADSAACEIETRLGDGSLRRTANFFHLDAAGRIVRLSVYKRGDW
jgi:ketosteroid isomerase-like protein